jgi:hypothetical protein
MRVRFHWLLCLFYAAAMPTCHDLCMPAQTEQTNDSSHVALGCQLSLPSREGQLVFQVSQRFAQTHSAARPLQHHDVTEQVGNPVAVGLGVEQGPVNSVLLQAKDLKFKVVRGTRLPVEDHHTFRTVF